MQTLIVKQKLHKKEGFLITKLKKKLSIKANNGNSYNCYDNCNIL